MLKKVYTCLAIAALIGTSTKAQWGVGTTTPHSTLDVRGSFALSVRDFTGNTSATITDSHLRFTGTTATTVTLPSAVGITGRTYYIKHAGSGSPDPVLTIATTSSQTIEGFASWSLNAINEAIQLVSDGSNWIIASQGLANSNVNWLYDGNAVGGARSVGTMSNYSLPFITNNIERLRILNSGGVAIGATSLAATNPEELLVDAGTTTSVNVISGKGSINSYLQLNIQNRSNENTASSDLVASNNTATESVNYVDLGINSSGFSNPAYPILDGANNAYLYATGNDLIIGNGTSGKNLSFFSGGTATTNEHIRITSTGLVGVGDITPTEKLTIGGNLRLSGSGESIFFDSNIDPYAGIKTVSRTGEISELMLFSGNDISGSWGPDRIRLASHELHFATSPNYGSIGSGDPSSYYESTTDVPTRMLINEEGNVAIGTTTFNATTPEQLLVDAGATTSYNVISGKGNINNYLQLNIQNNSSGTSASADIVASANNATETANFVNLGINSSGYSSGSIMGGANNAYLHATGNDFIIGNYTNNKSLIFYTTVSGNSVQRMSITNVGLIPGADNTYSLGANGSRNTAIWAVNGTIQTSDKRLKKNIHDLPYGLKDVLKLNPVAYNWIDEKTPGNKIGLIAQEVKKVIPEVVTGDETKEKLGMNYAELIPVLINAIQELKRKVEILKKKAEVLESSSK